jgi:Protein of unknown function (DUF3667)
MSEIDTANITTIKCLNCETDFEGIYCPQCGQSGKTGKLNLRTLISGILAGMFDLEKPLYRTLIGLATKPGTMISNYIDGKRKSYANPIKFGLATSALLMLMTRLRGSLTDATMEVTDSFPDMDEAGRQFALEYAKITEAMDPYNQILTLLLIPLIAGLFSLFFRKANRSYTDNIAFSFYIMGFIDIIVCFLMLLNIHNLFPSLFSSLNPLIFIVYFSWASIVFFKTKPFAGIFKSLLLYFSFFAIQFLILTIIVLVRIQVI